MKFTKPSIFYVFVVLLLIPALLINLGMLTFIDDEGIRALVALEMGWSDNYITPTLHGYYYYNKPPLWNWILSVSFFFFGEANEFSARFPTVVCLLAYGVTIYYYSRKHFDQLPALLNALLFLTCGRILLWDSMLALIDICFSWCMFTLFMVIFHRFRKQEWLWLFVLSYVLMAIGFLLKGLPAIVFQGITLLSWFIYKKSFRRLFSWQHVVGGLLAVFLVGMYYLAYHQYNSLYEIFPTLFSESSKRTVVRFGLGETLVHFFQFPLEMVYHFLPWSLLVIYFFRKGVFTYLRKHEFAVFCLLVFLTNILPYWTSPEVYPRYLLMHAPLIFTVYLYLHQWHKRDNSWHYRALAIFFGIVILAVTLGALYPLFEPLPTAVPAIVWKSVLLFISMAFISWVYIRRKVNRMITFVAAFLIFRIAFNWFVIPDRTADEVVRMVKDMPTEVGERWQDKAIKVYAYTLMEPTNSFYLERAYGGIIPRRFEDFRTNEVYIINLEQYPLPEYTVRDSFYARHERHMYYVVTLPEPMADPVPMLNILDDPFRLK